MEQDVLGLPTTQAWTQGRIAARRAQGLSLLAAAATAVVPTAFAAQGMVMVGQDALGLSLAFAVALAAFLELALISSALLARASAMAGRPAGADSGAVWVFSAVSGLFSATHELIGVDPATGQRGWQHGALSLLAAGVADRRTTGCSVALGAGPGQRAP